MKSQLLKVLAIITALLVVWFVMPHSFGPYYGVVVDKETNAPLEGAVVFVNFYTLGVSPGGSVTYYADALETLTDADGRFHFTKHRIWKMKLFHYWQKKPRLIVFKGGYGAFDRHGGVTITPEGFPEDQDMMISLPKLMTLEERWENVRGLMPSGQVPKDKYMELKKAKKAEMQFVEKR